MERKRWLWLGAVSAVLLGLGVYGLWALLARPDQLLLQAHIVDDQTGQPVRGTVYLNGIPTLRDVDNFTIVVPSGAERFEVAVEAPGYERWSMSFRYRFKRGYLLKGPIRLRRAH